MTLDIILEKIQEEVKIKEGAKQEIQQLMRRATRISKKAIHFVHKNQISDAVKGLQEARTLITKMQELSQEYLDLSHGGIVDSAFEEYSEANILLGLVRDNTFVDFEDLKVPALSYVLGLADVIGELRRRALDSLRRSDCDTAEKSLEWMELIYSDLVNLNDAYYMIKGLRRKCDIARRIIEATRGDVTVEVRRNGLENSIKKLRKVLEIRTKV